MIGPELRLKAVDGVAEWRGHHSCIGDDHVESLPPRQEFVGAGADALQVGQIERDQLEAPSVRGGILSHLRGCGFGFRDVPHRSYYLRAVGRKRSRCLHPDPRRYAGDENPFSVQIDAR